MGKPTGEAGLPRSLAVLWKRADRRRRALSLERIVAAAIEIADTEGLVGLSMARVAERLGCATMSLYRHVANKDELLVFMMDAAPGAPPALGATEAEWREGLTRWARELRAVYLRHPWVLQITGSSPPLEPGQLAWLDCGLNVLRTTRLQAVDKLSVIMLVLYYVRGEAQLAAARSASGTSGTRGAAVDDRQVMARYGRILAELVDPEHLPAVAEVVAAGVFEPGPDDAGPNPDFEFGLARLLDGVEAFARRGR